MARKEKRAHRGGRRRYYRLRRAGYIMEQSFRRYVREPVAGEKDLESFKKIHESEVMTLRERLLRTHADMDNLRKRARREREEIIKFANESLVSYILPVLDNFSHALKASESEEVEDAESFKQGVGLIHQQLLKILLESGLEKIDAEEKEFDPHLHEAMSTTYDENLPENLVMEVLRDGYIFNGRIIRPAMVRVNIKPQKTKTSSHAVKPNPKIKPEPLDTKKGKKKESSEEKPQS